MFVFEITAAIAILAFFVRKYPLSKVNWLYVSTLSITSFISAP